MQQHGFGPATVLDARSRRALVARIAGLRVDAGSVLVGDDAEMGVEGISRRWQTRVGVAAAAGGFGGLVWFLTGKSQSDADQSASVAGFLLAYVVAAATFVAWLVRRSGTSIADLDLSQVAARVALAIRNRWEDEAAIRQLNEPFPMSVRWRAADAETFADWTSLIRLARTGAGWPSAPSDGWARDADGLRGADRDLRAVLGRVPTGRLVILGEPGSGKTVLLVRLMLDLLEHRTVDQPVPVLLSLASWNPSEQALRHWIEQRLIADHIALAAPAQDGRAKSLAGALLEAGLILPVLDGLDEIPEAVRGFAIIQINAAMRPGQRLVLSSRSEEYRAAVRPVNGVEVHITGAAGVQLCPLEPDVVGGHLAHPAGESNAARRWRRALSALAEDPASSVAGALSTPLMVALARAIYNPRQGEDPTCPTRHPDELLGFENRSAVEEHLLDHFVAAAYRPHPDPARPTIWTAEQAERWLAYLARKLENLPDPKTDIKWWELPLLAPRALAGVTMGVIGTLAGALGFRFPIGFGIGLIMGLVTAAVVRSWIRRHNTTNEGSLAQGLAGGLLGGLTGALASHALVGGLLPADRAGPVVLGGLGLGIAVAVTRNFAAGLVGGLAGGLGGWLVEAAVGSNPSLAVIVLANGLGLGVTAGIAVGVARRRDPTQGHRWSPVGVVYGLVTGAVAGLAVSTIAGPRIGLLVGGAAALAGGLAGGWLLRVAATDLIKASGPQTVLRRDRIAFFTSFLGLGLAVGLGNGLQVAVGTNLKGSVNGLWVGIETGLINLVVVGLAFGFLQACWGSFSLARWWLAASRRLPWRLMTFLADAHTNRGVLRQVGAVYQFRHLDLQRRLAGDR